MDDLDDWWRPAAQKQLKGLPKDVQRRILKKAQEARANPNPTKAHKLHGVHPPKYRVQVGDYRIVYEIDEFGVKITDVGDRKDVYRAKY